MGGTTIKEETATALENLLRLIDAHPHKTRPYVDLYRLLRDAPLDDEQKSGRLLNRRTEGHIGRHYVVRDATPITKVIQVMDRKGDTMRRYAVGQFLGKLTNYEVVDENRYTRQVVTVASPQLAAARQP